MTAGTFVRILTVGPMTEWMCRSVHLDTQIVVNSLTGIVISRVTIETQSAFYSSGRTFSPDLLLKSGAYLALKKKLR